MLETLQDDLGCNRRIGAMLLFLRLLPAGAFGSQM